MAKRFIPAVVVALAAISLAAPAAAQPACELHGNGKVLVSLAANIKTAKAVHGGGSRAPANPALAALQKDGGGREKPADATVKVRVPRDGTAGGGSHDEREA